MFKIIGADNQPYGPVSLETLRQWIAEGRVNGETRVQAEGSEEWKPLASVPELAALLAGAPAATAPQATAPADGLNAPVQATMPGVVPAMSGGETAVRAAVRVPAILLIIAGGLGIVGALVGLVQHLMGAGMMPLPPEIPPELARLVRAMSGPPVTLTNLALSVVILFGGLSLLNLRRWGLALAASLVALLCGNTCCCPIGLVGGIWALVQLFKPEVKSVFR